MRNAVAIAAVAVTLAACSNAPDKLDYDGAPFAKVKQWKLLNSANAAEYGDKARKLTFAWTKDGTPEALEAFLVEQASKSMSMEAWLVDAQPTSLCRTGRNVQDGRMFVEVRVCEKMKGTVVCADDDEQQEIKCYAADEPCKAAKSAELCKGRVEAKTPLLEAAMKKIVG